MRPETFHSEELARFLERHTIATLAELKEALGTEVDSTVFRKLKELAYRTSYSHRGRYYTLDALTRFDELGLWSFRSVWFSIYGTLVSTVEALVNASEAGYFASELENVLHVAVKAPLLKLVRDERVVRERVAGGYLYLSSEAPGRRHQVAARQVHEAEVEHLGLGAGMRVFPEELKAAIVLFYSLLDEKERRLYAGLESLKIGHGGDQQVADLLATDPSTVARGRRQLLQRDIEIDRVRRKGGGRKPLEKKRQRSSPRSKNS